MDAEARIQRLLQFIHEGRVIRHRWHDTDEAGRETACLLGALGKDIHHATQCPASVMPRWLAHMTPAIDDRGSTKEWGTIVRRYGELASRWHVLERRDWDRAKDAVVLALVRRVWPEGLDDLGLFLALERGYALQPGTEPTKASVEAAVPDGPDRAQIVHNTVWIFVASVDSMIAGGANDAASDVLHYAAHLEFLRGRAAGKLGGEVDAWDRVITIALDTLEAAIAAKEARAA